MVCFMHGTNKLYLRFCTVADELNDKIYKLGGYYKTTKAYIYTISTNSWSAMWDSSLKSSSKVSGNYSDTNTIISMQGWSLHYSLREQN